MVVVQIEYSRVQHMVHIRVTTSSWSAVDALCVGGDDVTSNSRCSREHMRF